MKYERGKGREKGEKRGKDFRIKSMSMIYSSVMNPFHFIRILRSVSRITVSDPIFFFYKKYDAP